MREGGGAPGPEGGFDIHPPLLPDGGVLLTRTVALAWIVLGFFFLDRLTLVLVDLWLLDSLGYPEVFWTNFRAQALLFGGGLAVGFVGVAAAGWLNPVSRRARWVAVNAGLLLGLLGGTFLAGHYREFLMFRGGQPFGETDPLFGRDLGFFVFTLPAVRTTVFWLLSAVGAALLFAVIYAHLAETETDQEGEGGRGPEKGGASGPFAEGFLRGRLPGILARVSTPPTLFTLMLFAVVASAAIWLRRYEVLYLDNTDSGIFTGVSYIDATGLFSTVNYYAVTAVVVVVGAAGLVYLLNLLRQRLLGSEGEGWKEEVRWAAAGVFLLVLFDGAFRVAVLIRDVAVVSPNEPVIQLHYIDRHIQATRAGYALEDLEEITFIPSGPGDPVPSAEFLLESPTLRNAPLWPGFVSRLERLLDPQHAERILQTAGDPTVYGPTLEIFRQQEKLRTYYDFLDMDVDRYRIDGENRMFVTSVRELPLIEPQPWLAWWGQRFVLFTHGWGMVLAPAGEMTPEGEPRYAVRDIPATTPHPELEVENPRIYHGEGSLSMAYTNVREMQEFDYPTEEGRAEYVLPDTVPAGIHLDSFLKRMVFGWSSRQFFDIVFSRLIGEETRAHIYRTPLERVEKVAPFLYLDTDPFAFIRGDRIHWMVNAVSYTDRYPNSRRELMGDKSVARTRDLPEPTRVNYVRDAVKATVDAYTGQVELYKVADEPVVDTWAAVYPSLFRSAEEMPSGVRDHLQYPLQLFHIQFDDVYIYYRMTDPMTFFNMEDMWDDGDEVLGPILDRGKAITFSVEPYRWMVGSGPWAPVGDEGAQEVLGGRFAMSMLFTPEMALNLRGFPTVYQDGDEYGRIVVRTIPKGRFVMGPEQADATIDQNPDISRLFALWNRMGMDVIRGHTTGLLIGDELLYVEPVFLRSQQNPAPQLRRVSVVYRGEAYMGRTLEDAVRRAVAGARGEAPPVDPGLFEMPESGE